MEELLVYAILLYEGLVTEGEYSKRLDILFLDNPKNDDLLYWESLPGNIQNIEPFWILSYADDPLSWGDEEQTRNIYKQMLHYYEG
ncbi:MAG: hypothetical protein HFI38_14250 [Lachnospiraceae bacterium]|jgi:hypothetical protein|nr:hypothetical protein [Lachnospiraceae bacterium]